MTTTPPGWYDDGHGALRWWDGAQWTEHVSDQGRVTSDPPIAGPAPATPDDVPADDVPPEAAGYAAPASSPGASSGGFGATRLGAPPPGTGASAPGAWSQPAAGEMVKHDQ